MRARFKVLCSIFAAFMILASFSVLVSASTEIASGTVKANYSDFDYVLYSDGLLKVATRNRTCQLDELSADILSKVKSVEFDVTDAAYDGVHYDEMGFWGGNCKATEISVTTDAGTDFYYVYFYDFSELSGNSGCIAFPEDSEISGISIDRCPGISSVDFLEDLNVHSLYLNNCTKLITADLSATTITYGGFYGCSNLTELILPDQFNIANEDGYGGLSGCTSLRTIRMPIYPVGNLNLSGVPVESVKIPSGTSALEYGAFLDCKELKTVYIPASVTGIACNAFDGCSSLTDVYYGGCEEQWKDIPVWYDNSKTITLDDMFGNAKIHFDYEYPEFWYEDTWIVEDGEHTQWKYYDKTGDYVTGWKRIGAWYYFDDDGVMQTGWIKLDGVWYYLRPSGSMYTGWLLFGDSWYYLKSSGAMATGWEKVGGKWYLFNGGGVMLTGWQKDGGKWYYLESSGAMKTGWLLSGGKWYYLNPNGSMATGWVKSGGLWYYMDPSSGAMVTGTLTINGKTYRFADDGHCLNP